MSDKAILKVFQDSANYYRFSPYIKGYSILDETKTILEVYGKYYDNVSKFFDLEDFLAFCASQAHISEESYKKIHTVMLQLQSYDNDSLATEIIKNYLDEELAERLAEISNEAIDGRELDIESITELVKEYQYERLGEEEDRYAFAPTTIKELKALNTEHVGYNWTLPTLTKHYPKLRKGDLVHVFANSNVGKTSFIVNECLNFMKEGANVLWVNNEEMVSRVNERFYHCATGRDVFNDSESRCKEAQEEVDAIYSLSTRLKALQVPTGVFTQKNYEELVEHVRPDVVVFNNLDKVKAKPDDANSAQHLQQVYCWARTVASLYNCAVVGVAQASANAINELRLDKSHLADCKVGKAGECDLIIGIGYNDQSPEDRQINLVKNKIGREVNFLCTFDHTTGRYIEAVKESYGY